MRGTSPLNLGGWAHPWPPTFCVAVLARRTSPSSPDRFRRTGRAGGSSSVIGRLLPTVLHSACRARAGRGGSLPNAHWAAWRSTFGRPFFFPAVLDLDRDSAAPTHEPP